ncbi:MAG: DUF748 domain-containing protein [Candidatus Omnitrophica bacterium]|nr:DUF748 domain-containing protein [Candidatus Omnitrophota bacterium]
MRRIIKITSWIVIFISLLYLILNIGLVFLGKKIIVRQIEKNIKNKVTLEGLNLSLPFSLNLSNLKIHDLISIDYLFLRPSILGFLAGKIILNELKIIKPVLNIEMDEEGRFNPVVLKDNPKPKMLLLVSLKIKDGRLIFMDKRIKPRGYRMILDNINIDIFKVSFPPVSLLTRFNLSSSLLDNSNNLKGSILAFGWIDLGHKDMEGRVELKDFELIYLQPYYQRYNLINKKIVSGRVNLISDLKAVNNDLIAKCHFEVSDLSYEREENQDKQTTKIDIINDTLKIFSNKEKKIALDFTINTKLDKPRIELKDLKKVFIQAILQNLISKPSEESMKDIKDIGKQFDNFW